MAANLTGDGDAALLDQLRPVPPPAQAPVDMPEDSILQFFAGPDGPEALGQSLTHEAPHLTHALFSMDKCRSPRHDLMAPEIFSHLMEKARGGSIMAVMANLPGQAAGDPEGWPCTLRVLAIALMAHRAASAFLFLLVANQDTHN